MAGSTKVVVQYLNQDFEKLKSQCLSKKELFSDDTFPAAPQSLGFKLFGPDSKKAKGVEWKRPKDIVQNPEFIIQGATKSDINQGDLADCWLMSAIASLTLDQDILARVINPEQSFKENYAGIFHFQLWQYGQWVDVVIDDYLPTKNGRLMFVQSVDRHEFWSALLEKAYAKVNGSYEALGGGFGTEAFEDFTGGIAETYKLDKAPPNLFSIMKKALSRGSLLSTFISASAKEGEHVTEELLVKNHVYSVTGAEEVHMGGDQVQLVRLRNPWGHKEWNGAWSDNSAEWDHVLPQEKTKLNHSADDGEFWMAYSDFVIRYSRLEICNLTPDVLSSDHVGHWELQQFEGSWEPGTNAGGSNKNAASFSINPQFEINLEHKSQGTGPSCSLLVGLMQKDIRKEKELGHDLNEICFSVYPLARHKVGRLSSEELSRMKAIVISEHASRREVCKRFNLPPGKYVIIPSTYEPNHEGSFVLRVFLDK